MARFRGWKEVAALEVEEGGRGGRVSRATERERERENREAWRTGEPTPGGSQSINSLTRSPTKRDLLLLSPYARNATIYTANLEASITYAHSACLQPFCNRSPCTVSSRISSPPLRERERERRRRNRRRRSCAHTFEDDERERERIVALGEIKGIGKRV